MSRGKESSRAKTRGCISQIRETANWFRLQQLELSMETMRAEANTLQSSFGSLAAADIIADSYPVAKKKHPLRRPIPKWKDEGDVSGENLSTGVCRNRSQGTTPTCSATRRAWISAEAS